MSNKFYANRGVKRNKKPLQNLVYEVTIVTEDKLKASTDLSKYKFKDEGYLWLNWKYQKQDLNYSHGFITPSELRIKLGEKQWSKFCSGKREFIIQRRENNGNI